MTAIKIFVTVFVFKKSSEIRLYYRKVKGPDKEYIIIIVYVNFKTMKLISITLFVVWFKLCKFKF